MSAEILMFGILVLAVVALLVALGQGMTQTGTVAQSIVGATAAIREELTRAKNDLTDLQTQAKARQEPSAAELPAPGVEQP